MTIVIRPEQAGDVDPIRELTRQAFATAAHSDGTEADIIDALRGAAALHLSLVAEDRGAVVGHAAFSPVMIDATDLGWFGLGPIAILPSCQGDGIGSRLVRDGLERLRASGASGCVVLGEPDYYARFGFSADPRLTFAGPPPRYFQALCWRPPMPSGKVDYHPAFGAE